VFDAGREARASGALHDAIRARAGLPLDDVEFQQGAPWRSRAADDPAYAQVPPGGATGMDRRDRIELQQALTPVLWLGLARPDRRSSASAP